MASFNTTVRQMSGMFQWPKYLSKKWPKCFSEEKPRFWYASESLHYETSWLHCSPCTATTL